jgi:DNA-binding CsgD family transcriptional regulator
MSRLRLEHARGQRRRCDAAQTRHHIERLRAAGWTQAQIARAANLAYRTVGGVTAGANAISKRTALAILSIPIGPAPSDTRDVDATGTIRRLRALAAIGWPIAHVADRLGMYPTAVSNIARGRLDHVRATTAELVAREYRALCRTPGPSQRVRTEARAKGWHSPAAWDGNIDDPAAQPEIDQPNSLELKRGALAAVRRAEIEHLAAFNLANHEIADRLGISLSTVNAIVRELHNGQKRLRKQVAA